MLYEALGMIFSEAVDFGSIKRNDDGGYTLLAADITKLNTMLTRQALGSKCNVLTGATALVLDTSKIYMYNGDSDTWYEWGSESEQEPASP